MGGCVLKAVELGVQSHLSVTTMDGQRVTYWESRGRELCSTKRAGMGQGGKPGSCPTYLLCVQMQGCGVSLIECR